MSGAMREKDAADYDLERFTEMFDQALISNDPRVKNALRQLMMMVILTDTDDHEGERRARHGPLRQMQQDMRDQFRWIQRLEQEIETLKKQIASTHGIGGYRSQGWPRDYDPKYDSIFPKDYYNQAIPPGDTMEQISKKINGGLNIKVASDTKDK